MREALIIALTLAACGKDALPPPPARGDDTPITADSGGETGGTVETGDSAPPADSESAVDTGGADSSEPRPFYCEDGPPAPALDPATWHMADPAPGGDIYTLTQAPGRPEFLLAASTMNGFYTSEDRGLTWRPLMVPITHAKGQIVSDPGDPSTALISTGELLRLESYGASAVSTGFGDDADPEQQIFGMTWHDGGVVLVDAEGEVFRTEDMGRTLTELGAIAFDAPPPDAGHEAIYFIDDTWTHLASTASGALLAARHRSGLYRSTDGGRSWSTLDTGAYNILSLGASGDAAWIAMDGAFRTSEDAGETWSEVPTGDIDILGAARTAGGRWLLSADDQVYTVEGGLLQEWSTPSAGHHLGAMLVLDDGAVLMTHKDGVLRSSDEGLTWADSSEGMVDDDLGPLMVHPECENLVWVGTECERGVFTSVDWGGSLAHLDYFMHYVMVMRISPADPWTIWVTTDDKLLVSPDLGESWSQVAPDVIEYHMHGLDVAPDDPDLVLVGSVGDGEYSDDGAHVYRSADAGQTWERIAPPLADDQTSIHGIHFVRADPDVVLFGTFRGGDYNHAEGSPGSGIYRSTDRGQSWAHVDTPAGDAPVFAECDGAVYAATDAGLLRSDDLGASWVSTLETDDQFLAVACHGDRVFAFDRSGVRRSDDRGASWADFSEGLDLSSLPVTFMPQLAVSPDGAMLYLAVARMGLARRSLAD